MLNSNMLQNKKNLRSYSYSLGEFKLKKLQPLAKKSGSAQNDDIIFKPKERINKQLPNSFKQPNHSPKSTPQACPKTKFFRYTRHHLIKSFERIKRKQQISSTSVLNKRKKMIIEQDRSAINLDQLQKNNTFVVKQIKKKKPNFLIETPQLEQGKVLALEYHEWKRKPRRKELYRNYNNKTSYCHPSINKKPLDNNFLRTKYFKQNLLQAIESSQEQKVEPWNLNSHEMESFIFP